MSLKNIVLSVAIAVLTICVAVYGINTFYPSPEYNSYCPEYQTAEYIDSPQRCEANSGYWYPYEEKTLEGEINGYCDRNYYCHKDFNSAQETWYRNIFFIGLPLGILIIIVGAFLFSLEFVGVGLMWGGVVTMVYSTWGFFLQSVDWIKFTISLVALAVIISFAYWYNKRVINNKHQITRAKAFKKKKVKRR